MGSREEQTDGGSPRRRELLHKTLNYVTEQGISDLSLRPLAAAIGTSPRVLLYLFGSKDGLLRDVMALARRVQLEAMTQFAPASESSDADLQRLWNWLTDDEHRPILRLFLEAYVRSLDQAEPWQDFAIASVSEWLDILRPLSPSSDTPGDGDIHATLALAVIRGLFLDLVATGETARATAAFHRYLDIRAGARNETS